MPIKVKRLTAAQVENSGADKANRLVAHDLLALPGVFYLSTYGYFKDNFEAKRCAQLYAVPANTVALLVTISRDTHGNTPNYYYAYGLNSKTPVKKDMAAKLLSVLLQREQAICSPVRVVFGIDDANKLFVVTEQIVKLPAAVTLKVNASLIASGVNSAKALRNLPQIRNLSFVSVSGTPAYKGIPISGGVVQCPTKQIFIKEVTTPSDVDAMLKASAVITSGGALSHAALLAGSEGLACIVGVAPEALEDLRTKEALTLNCQTGEIYFGHPTIKEDSDLKSAIATILEASTNELPLSLYLNADSAGAIIAGIPPASGVGLFRTEHMYQKQQSSLHQYLILAENEPRKAMEPLSTLLYQSYQIFSEVVQAVSGKPLIIRLLDAPLKEFNPKADETNPMMGLRGCRFGIIHSEFYAMQVQALALAYRKYGVGPIKIMVPLVAEVGEVVLIHDLIRRIWRRIGAPDEYLSLGAMIETPRACLISGELAACCDFLSYGTNDLTQFTFGLSRDDSTYLAAYQDLGAIDCNPFQTIDRGVGRLIWFSAQAARTIKPTIPLGLCGNHASDPASIALVKQLNFSYISCTESKLAQAAVALLAEG